MKNLPKAPLPAKLAQGRKCFEQWRNQQTRRTRLDGLLLLSAFGLTVDTGFEIFTILWIAASAAIYNHTEREQVSYIMQ